MQKKLLNKKEASLYIGVSVSKIEKIIDEDPTFPRGREVGDTTRKYYFRDELDGWLESLKDKQ
jgi:predicted DNA-binding transcriptional regulator AlpA